MRSVFLLAAAATLFATSAFAQQTIPVGHFQSIELRGGGHVVLHNGPAQRVTLANGSTQFTSFHVEDQGNLVIDACNDDCPHQYDLRVDITTPEISGIAIEGGGEIDGAGDLHANHLNLAVNGGGHIDMRDVHVPTVEAAVNGGGHIETAPDSSLHAAVSGGGLIEYWGNPKVSSAVNGGGHVRQRS